MIVVKLELLIGLEHYSSPRKRLLHYESMDKPSTADELRDVLEGDRYQILECLARHGDLSSSEIRDLTEIPEGSTHYQLSLLESWKLSEPVGTQYVGEYDTGIPATIYTLTKKGQTVVAEH